MFNLWLQNIPASGQTLWCTLEKKGKSKKQGDVKIRLSFSSEKNFHVASQEHRHLLRLMLLHELENSKVCCLCLLMFLIQVLIFVLHNDCQIFISLSSQFLPSTSLLILCNAVHYYPHPPPSEIPFFQIASS